MVFSEQMGFASKTPIITNNLSDEQKNAIFNFFYEHIRDDNYNNFFDIDLVKDIWTKFCKKNIMQLGTNSYLILSEIQSYLSQSQWFKYYDFLEFLANNSNIFGFSYNDINELLNRERCGYKFFNDKLIPVTNDTDMNNIERAINLDFDNGHLSKAIDALAIREKPNYSNVVRESIDAVDIVARKIAMELFNGSKKDTLKESVNLLADNNFIDDHQAYQIVLKKLYGYASDGGFRHPMLDPKYTIDQADATFILSICSAFVSMLVSKYNQAN